MLLAYKEGERKERSLLWWNLIFFFLIKRKNGKGHWITDPLTLYSLVMGSCMQSRAEQENGLSGVRGPECTSWGNKELCILSLSRLGEIRLSYSRVEGVKSSCTVGRGQLSRVWLSIHVLVLYIRFAYGLRHIWSFLYTMRTVDCYWQSLPLPLGVVY